MAWGTQGTPAREMLAAQFLPSGRYVSGPRRSSFPKLKHAGGRITMFSNDEWIAPLGRSRHHDGIVGLSPTLASSQLNAVRLHTTFKMNYLPAGKRGSFCFNFKTGLKRSPSFLTRDTASVADGALDNQGALSRSTTFAFTASQHSGDTPSGQSRHTTTRTKPCR